MVLIFMFMIDNEDEPLFIYLGAIHEMPVCVFSHFIIIGLSSYFLIEIPHIFWVCIFCQLYSL